ncbi:hypothetical protein A4A49_57521 [Nicotiana attenuata]|uniref:Myb-like domain-containing protein n=1 Tax=Nicotiana attenuata TaxID=49451 RepID=A0A1J6IZQ6_NICAT|nr:hypothetical protein A4A49_57521 [Nicotiana attenuata]
MNSQTSSNKVSKKSSNSTPSTRRMWIPEEEHTLLDGLKELGAKGWRADNRTFRPGHLMELERYIHKQHPKRGLKEANAYHSPKVFTGEVENATGYSAFTEVENATEPSSFIGEAENITGHSAFTGAENATGPSVGASENEHIDSQQTHKQGAYDKRSSSNVNKKEKSKKRKKIMEDDNETFLKGMMEIMKSFTESQDKRMGPLIEKIGDRDRSNVRGQIYSILESPVFELYTIEQRIKASMILCDDDKKMKLFLRMGEFERHTMISMLVNDKL